MSIPNAVASAIGSSANGTISNAELISNVEATAVGSAVSGTNSMSIPNITVVAYSEAERGTVTNSGDTTIKNRRNFCLGYEDYHELDDFYLDVF